MAFTAGSPILGRHGKRESVGQMDPMVDICFIEIHAAVSNLRTGL